MEIAKNSFLTYINAGGTIKNLKKTFQDEQKKQKPKYLGDIELGNITGDGTAEVFIWIALPSSEAGLSSPLTIEWIK